jgi:hypothetical protein
MSRRRGRRRRRRRRLGKLLLGRRKGVPIVHLYVCGYGNV